MFTFQLKSLPDLLARRAVNARVCDLRLPLAQVFVLLLQRLKDTAFQSIFLSVIDCSLDLSLVARGSRLRG